MGPRIFPVEKVIDNEYSKFTMPSVEFVEPVLCGKIHDMALISHRLTSMIKT